MKNRLIVVLLLVAVLSLTLCACTANSYEIKFVDENGTELDTVKVDEGGEVVYNGKEPVKASTAEFDYTFAGWSDADGIALEKLPVATANATYTARFNSVKRSYEIKFVNGENTLQNETLEYGTKIEYKGNAPQKAATPAETYTFQGWSLSENGEIVNIENATVGGAATYYAVFASDKVMYKVTWVVGENSTETHVEYNTAPAYNGETPTKASTETLKYNFEGWAKTENGQVVNLAEEKVTADVTYYAVFSEEITHYQVKFVSGQEELQNGLVAKNAAPVYNGIEPTKAMTESETFKFAGWAKTDNGQVVDLTKEAITADTTYYAMFTSSVRMYKAYWKIDSKTESTDVAYNTAPVYNGETPTKASTETLKYNFEGWAKTENGQVVNLAEEKVTADVTYYAVFSEEITHYQVKFVSGQNELQKGLVAKNTAPVYNGETPTKAFDDTYTYTFAGWTKTENGEEVVDLTKEAITADTTYYAVFNKALRVFNITWHVKGQQTQTELKVTDELKYNNEFSLEDYSDEDYNYTFNGWSLTENGEIVELDSLNKAEVTDIYAVFNSKIKQYTLTVKYAVEGSDEVTQKQLILDKYTIYGQSTVDANGVDTLTADKDGYLADKPWVAGRLTADETVTVTYRVANVWDGSIATAYESGDGTAENPYIIKTGAQLAYMSAQYSGKDSTTHAEGLYFKLAANIDLSGHEWTPIAHRSNYTNTKWSYFAGNFDGQGYIVKITFTSSTAVGYGLFEGVKGAVKNVTILGSMSAKNRCGGIAYMLGQGGVVENCINYASIESTGNTDGYVGGMIGASNAACSVVNCTNYGKISSATNYAGGIIGNLKTATVNGCVNYGDVVYTGQGDAKHKGLAGIGGWVTTNSAISDCQNYGNVTGYSNVGGIAGYLGAGSTFDEACKNYGKVEGHDSTNDLVGSNANK